MKKLIATLVLTFSVGAVWGQPLDGNYWTSLSEDEKTLAIELMIEGSLWFSEELRTTYIKQSVYYWATLMQSASKNIPGLIKGLDEYYTISANRSRTLSSALCLAASSL